MLSGLVVLTVSMETPSPRFSRRQHGQKSVTSWGTEDLGPPGTTVCEASEETGQGGLRGAPALVDVHAARH